MDKNDIWNNLKPNDLQQGFAQVNLRILCMHYWWLKAWRYKNLALPFWRIYWNDREGAEILFDGKTIPLGSNNIAIISPNTEYSSRLNTDDTGNDDFLYGGPSVENVVNPLKDTEAKSLNALNHLFIHFTLGISNTMLPKGVFVIDVGEELRGYLDELIGFGTANPGVFSLRECMVINSFINAVLARIPDKEWGRDSLVDSRIHEALVRIEKDKKRIPTNTELAEAVYLSKDAFIRIFKSDMGLSPHKYILKQRIDEAAMLLLHNKNIGIEEVALGCGFEDRNYFTRIFTKIIGLPPARYRRMYLLGRQ